MAAAALYLALLCNLCHSRKGRGEEEEEEEEEEEQ